MLRVRAFRRCLQERRAPVTRVQHGVESPVGQSPDWVEDDRWLVKVSGAWRCCALLHKQW